MSVSCETMHSLVFQGLIYILAFSKLDEYLLNKFIGLVLKGERVVWHFCYLVFICIENKL